MTRSFASIWLIAVGVVATALAACDADGPKDMGGKTMQLGGWNKIEPYEADLNIPLLLGGKIDSIERQTRDNSIVEETLRFEAGKGYVNTQRAPFSWSERTTQRQSSEDHFREVTRQRWRDLVDIGIPTALKHRSKYSAGYYSLITVSGKKCLVARMAYRLQQPTGSYYIQNRLMDTYVIFEYCSPDVTFEQFADVLTTLDIVSDRTAFKAALLSAPPKP